MKGQAMDYVIEIDAVGGPCWVAAGGGEPGRTHRVEHAEVYETENLALENAHTFRLKYPSRKFSVVSPASNGGRGLKRYCL